ncbi:hypothetical protein GCM10027418_10820 [Mariniluteicoccus endophyticus]
MKPFPPLLVVGLALTACIPVPAPTPTPTATPPTGTSIPSPTAEATRTPSGTSTATPPKPRGLTLKPGVTRKIEIGTTNSSIGGRWAVVVEPDPAIATARITTGPGPANPPPGGDTRPTYVEVTATGPGTTSLSYQYCSRQETSVPCEAGRGTNTVPVAVDITVS